MSDGVSVWVIRSTTGGGLIQSVAMPVGVASLDEASSCLPGGAYTTLRTYQRDKVLTFGEQIKRLESSARLTGYPLRIDEDTLRRALRMAISARQQGGKSGSDLRLRLTLNLETQLGDLYIAAQALDTPAPEAYRQGVAIVTTTLQRLLPEAKLTRFITRSRPVRQSLPAGINEALMVNAQGELLEGLTSNFFAIRQGEIYTAEKGVLAGITRALALEGARRVAIRVHLQPVRLTELDLLQEAFITSSSRGVLPVCRVDSIQIGDGKPGPLTHRVSVEYEQLISERIERL